MGHAKKNKKKLQSKGKTEAVMRKCVGYLLETVQEIWTVKNVTSGSKLWKEIIKSALS